MFPLRQAQNVRASLRSAGVVVVRSSAASWRHNSKAMLLVEVGLVCRRLLDESLFLAAPSSQVWPILEFSKMSVFRSGEATCVLRHTQCCVSDSALVVSLWCRHTKLQTEMIFTLGDRRCSDPVRNPKTMLTCWLDPEHVLYSKHTWDEVKHTNEWETTCAEACSATSCKTSQQRPAEVRFLPISPSCTLCLC